MDLYRNSAVRSDAVRRSLQNALTGTLQTDFGLLAWFDKNARDLPWRRTRDPYAIWIAEIMLQQTQSETVKPYYAKFLRRFPTVERLAKARFDTVLKMWEGLGYYSRARNLHLAAGRIVRDFDGRVPQARRDLLKLPGIGLYTAGAIASIAFNRDEPVVDGNVTRVLCRLFRVREDPRSSRTQKRLWRLAEGLLPSGKARFFNQAMMELGATVCLPRSPHCDDCPLGRMCGAKAHGEQDRLPTRASKKPLPRHKVVVGVIYKKGKILIDKRKAGGLLGGLWEFPGGKVAKGESLRAALLREVREELGVRVRVVRPLVTVQHAYSHFSITLHAFECAHESGKPRCAGCVDYKWVLPGQLKKYAFPAANKKIFAALPGQEGKRCS
ncbi:MAG TPA: A/G-specific adenine glycosylase [Sedimentisphaerales bacterium]|nr:A/G-specific adenine glycosylase [Sedimentisphaerales bacterium]